MRDRDSFVRAAKTKAWTAYAPTVSGLTTASVAAEFLRIGRMLYLRFNVKVAAAASGTGANFTVSLPGGVTPDMSVGLGCGVGRETDTVGTMLAAQWSLGSIGVSRQDGAAINAPNARYVVNAAVSVA